MKGADILAEVEDVLRTMPSRQILTQDTQETFSWLGRVVAAINRWDSSAGLRARALVKEMQRPMAYDAHQGYIGLMVLLEEARADLRITTIGPINTAIGQGYVFDYFDEIRKVIALATADLFFIDPYLDANFVSQYLPHVPDGVQIRLLAREKVASLIPAVKLFTQQSKKPIDVRSAPGFHDRYFFIDAKSCYQSGASFKDGGRTAPTTITQITDAFPAVRQTYEDLWQKGKPEL
jgi:hypothetical protein